MTNDIDNPLKIGNPGKMTLQTSLKHINMFLDGLAELLTRDLEDMIVLLDLVLQGLLIVVKMFCQVGQVIDNCIIDAKHNAKFRTDVLEDALVYEADEHVSLLLAVSVFEYYV